MMNWKGFGRKRCWCNFLILYQHSPGVSEENYKKTQSEQSVSAPRLKLGPPEKTQEC
jgi:hypothetical protein